MENDGFKWIKMDQNGPLPLPGIVSPGPNQIIFEPKNSLSNKPGKLKKDQCVIAAKTYHKVGSSFQNKLMMISLLK